jgi:hypothetical protein
MSLGLSELMIVNPAQDGLAAMFIGRDGGLYGVETLGGLGDDSVGQYFLGDDGTLYQVGDAVSDGGDTFFLGDDGTLYERAR